MKAVKKYASFEELKSADRKPVSLTASLKKHVAFEKFIKSILSPNPSKSFFLLDFTDFTLDILPQIKADIK